MRYVTINWDRPTLLKALPVAVVATFAAIISYGHIETLALTHHQTLADSRMLPFAVDFLIVAGTVFVLNGFELGWLCIVLGVAGTLFANIESGVPYGWLSAAISSWPAVAFTAASFVLERFLRTRSKSAGQPELNRPEADLVAEAESALAEVAARPEPAREEPAAVAAQPEPGPAEEDLPDLTGPLASWDTVSAPEPLPAATDTEGRMATHVVAEWKARGELDKLWDMVDNLSQRDLADRLHLRSRNQGVRLKNLRAQAA